MATLGLTTFGFGAAFGFDAAFAFFGAGSSSEESSALRLEVAFAAVVVVDFFGAAFFAVAVFVVALVVVVFFELFAFEAVGLRFADVLADVDFTAAVSLVVVLAFFAGAAMASSAAAAAARFGGILTRSL